MDNNKIEESNRNIHPIGMNYLNIPNIPEGSAKINAGSVNPTVSREMPARPSSHSPARA